MAYQNTIARYEMLANLTYQMLLAVKQQDWDKLVELETVCAQHVDNLKNSVDLLPLTRDASERKLAILKRILAHDLEIRNLISPRMARIGTLMRGYAADSNVTQT